MSTEQTYKQSERLKSRKDIDALFENQENIFSFPIKLIYKVNHDAVNKVCISVPKRIFKKAVDRNRVKRQILECYRLNKAVFYDQNPAKTFNMMFVYIHKNKLDYRKIEKSIIQILSQLSSK